MLKRMLICSAVFGLTTVSLALGSVPKNVTNDTALYQEVSQIKVSPQKELSFDSDISRLANLEQKYQERLPLLNRRSRLSAPEYRIKNRKYKYSKSRLK